MGKNQFDLWGNLVESGEAPRTIIHRHRIRYHYRKAENKAQRCVTCENMRVNGYSRNYYKCLLIGLGHSFSTDIRLGHVCDAWRKKQK